MRVRVGWAVIVLVVGTLAVAGAADGLVAVGYRGQGDRAAMTVTISRHGRTADFNVSYRSPCDMAGVEDPREWGTSTSEDAPVLHLDRRGRFHLHRHYEGASETFDLHFAGRLGRHSARGTFTAHGVASDVTCDTGLVRWTARRH